MKKLKNEELKGILGGASPELVECICAFLDAGLDFDDAYYTCKKIFPR